MTAPTHFLQDILRQPEEMSHTIDYLMGPGCQALQKGRALIESAIQSSRSVFMTGIGASWNVAVSAQSLFQSAGRLVHAQEAGELLHFTAIPRGAVIVAISRTGRSIEIVQLLAKAKKAGAAVIGITNSPESPLARESAVGIAIPAKLDHAISVNAYSTLLIAAGALAGASSTGFETVAPTLTRVVQDVPRFFESWQAQLEKSHWLADRSPYYFLARGGSLGTCQEARLLWEEGVKMPATSMSTSGFRHGPQEIVRQGTRFCMWIDQSRMREQDLAVARDLRELCASVMLIGENLPADAGDFVCQLPISPPGWQFVVDVLPIQFAAERLSRLVGVDCDSFRVCTYVVEDEHGLLHNKAEVSQTTK